MGLRIGGEISLQGVGFMASPYIKITPGTSLTLSSGYISFLGLSGRSIFGMDLNFDFTDEFSINVGATSSRNSNVEFGTANTSLKYTF